MRSVSDFAHSSETHHRERWDSRPVRPVSQFKSNGRNPQVVFSTEFVIDKEDADILREMEKEFLVFSHMTPSYGSYKGCITVKGIITVTSTGEITPCPYIDMSFGGGME